MKLEVSRTINLDRVSKRAVEKILNRLGIPEEVESEKWKYFQKDILTDLWNSEGEAFEEVIAESFADQIHMEVAEKAARYLDNKDVE